MAKRIEQPREQCWTAPVLAVSESPVPPAAPEEPTHRRPTLKLVGGTDTALNPLDPLALPRA
jgi:hypothetical protein